MLTGTWVEMNDISRERRLDYFTPAVALRVPGDQQSISYQLAGSGARALAGMFDFAIQIVTFVVIARALYQWRPGLVPPGSWSWAVPLGFLEWHVLYLMLSESLFRGRTPGLALLGLRVISDAGSRPRPLQSVLRNLFRVPDVLGGYLTSFIMMNRTSERRSLGDRVAGTLVIYSTPLRDQMAAASVPESFYSTSEAGYLLQAWIERNSRMDTDSKSASALDLGAYLHSVYEPDARDLPEPSTYLHHLFEREMSGPEKAPGTNAPDAQVSRE